MRWRPIRISGPAGQAIANRCSRLPINWVTIEPMLPARVMYRRKNAAGRTSNPMSDLPFLSALHVIHKGEMIQTEQDILISLQDFWVPVEIELHGNLLGKPPTIQMSFLCRQWGKFGSVDLRPVDHTQTLVDFIIPLYPDEIETERFEIGLREDLGLPSFRLYMIDSGPRQEVIAYLGKQLQDRRLSFFQTLYTNLVFNLKMSPINLFPVEFPPEPKFTGKNHQDNNLTRLEENRDIPIVHERVNGKASLVSKKNDQLLDLWRNGLAAKEIANRLGRTEKTVLNSLTLLRRSLGDQVVPRRK
jgi:DNA-binding CsgD family transcriptional regulator